MQMIDLTNQKFGKILVLERDYSKTNGTYWKCRCDCGKEIVVRKDQLTRAKYPKRSCGCDQKEKASQTHLKDETGNSYGYLTVLYRTEDLRKGEARWHCKCKCGKEIVVRKDQLTRTKYPKRSCGCDQKEKASQTHLKDETGNSYGYLTVLYRTEDLRKGEARWHCKCKCGKETDVAGIHLRNGSVQSCGCKKYESKNKINEIGNQYGRLTVISQADKTDGTHIFWNCKCQCGSECVVSGSNLRLGITQSCGCLSSKGEEQIAKILIENQILFKKEFTFSDLKGVNNGLLRFDFAIFKEDGSISHLLEYD